MDTGQMDAVAVLLEMATVVLATKLASTLVLLVFKIKT